MLAVILGVFVVPGIPPANCVDVQRRGRENSAPRLRRESGRACPENQARLNPVIVRRGCRHNDNSHHRVQNAKYPGRQLRTASDNPRKSLPVPFGELSRRSKPATDSWYAHAAGITLCPNSWEEC